MIDGQFVAFLVVALAITLVPGADTMLVLRNVLARGVGGGLATAVGACTGLFVHATFSAVGLSALLVRSALVFDIVKFAGACYLIFLGIQSVVQTIRHQRATRSTTTTDTPADEPAQPSHGWARSYREGLLSNVLNPKVAMFYLAFLPQFINPTDPVLAKSLFLAAVHFGIGIGWLSLVVLFVGRTSRLLLRSSIRARLEMVSGVILVALGMRLALEHR
jgi:threonine/homoserine/homoserine lactone efflux protein